MSNSNPVIKKEGGPGKKPKDHEKLYFQARVTFVGKVTKYKNIFYENRNKKTPLPFMATAISYKH